MTRRPAKQTPAGVKPLLDLVELTAGADPRLQTLLGNVFGGTVLVKSYEQGMEVARDYDLNCITTDFQVIYAGAYLTQAGHYNRAVVDRFTLYKQLKAAKEEAGARELALNSLQSDRDVTEQADLSANQ